MNKRMTFEDIEKTHLEQHGYPLEGKRKLYAVMAWEASKKNQQQHIDKLEAENKALKEKLELFDEIKGHVSRTNIRVRSLEEAIVEAMGFIDSCRDLITDNAAYLESNQSKLARETKKKIEEILCTLGHTDAKGMEEAKE